MTIADVLTDGLNRISERVTSVAAGLSPDDLTWRPGPEANSIAWLLWHLTHVQDDHIAHAAATDQLWTTGGWYGRFGLPFDEAATGYGQSAAEVAAVRVEDPVLLSDYHSTVSKATVGWLATLDDAAFDREVDRWHGEPVTLAVRVVSVINDNSQHVGQAAYLRGLLGR